MFLQRRSERGQALVLIVFGMVALLGLTALSVDGGAAYTNRRQAQNTADAVALDAALTKVRGGDWSATGFERAASNGFDNNGTTNIVEIHNPPIDGLYVGDDEYIQVIITSYVDTYFGVIVGREQVTNRVQAIARAKPSTQEVVFPDNALVSLSPDNCGAVRVHGNASTTLLGGGLFVNSDCNKAFDQQGANAYLYGPGLCVVGGSDLQQPGNVPAPMLCDPIPYPPEIVPPSPYCATDSVENNGTFTPGNVSGTDLRGDVTLMTGLYCITGDVMINGHDTWYGQNVVLYFVDGGLHINGPATLQLDAPDDGPFKDLLIYVPMENDEDIIINGNSSSYFDGTILALASDIQINGTQGSLSHGQIIGYTLDLIGDSNAVIRYDARENYVPTVPPKVELVK